MAKIRKLVPVLLGIMLLTVGCGKSADKMMESAIENMKSVESYTLKADTRLVTQVQGQDKVDVKSMNEIKGTLKPEVGLSITNTTTLMTGKINETEEVVSYILEEDGNIAYYEKQGDTWYKLVVDGMDMLGGIVKKPIDVVKDLGECIEQYKVIEEVTLEDKICYKLEGTVSKDKFLQVIEVINQIQDLGLNEEAIDLMNQNQENFGEIIVECFVEKETNKLIKQSMNLSEMMRIGLQETIKSQGSSNIVNSVDCKMDITYKDINNTMMIKAPSELSKAKGL